MRSFVRLLFDNTSGFHHGLFLIAIMIKFTKPTIWIYHFILLPLSAKFMAMSTQLHAFGERLHKDAETKGPVLMNDLMNDLNAFFGPTTALIKTLLDTLLACLSTRWGIIMMICLAFYFIHPSYGKIFAGVTGLIPILNGTVRYIGGTAAADDADDDAADDAADAAADNAAAAAAAVDNADRD
jgi:hypothetical protein